VQKSVNHGPKKFYNIATWSNFYSLLAHHREAVARADEGGEPLEVGVDRTLSQTLFSLPLTKMKKARPFVGHTLCPGETESAPLG
jgi:hypothetical protein